MNLATKAIPTRIGSLEIDTANTSFMPFLRGNLLTLPSVVHEVHPLMGGTQYLIRTSVANMNRQPVGHYFFGLDDSPFLTAISRRRFEIFKQEGEQAFYEALKPKSIKLMADGSPNPVKRQGDIWAVKVADAWKDIGPLVGTLVIAPNCKAKRRLNYQQRLFDSRHELTGDIMQDVFVVIDVKPKKRISKNGRGASVNIKALPLTLASGVIKAPDHPHLFIEDGVYAIDRTTGQVEACSGMD